MLRAPTPQQLRRAADDLGLALTESEVDAYIAHIDEALDSYRALDALPDFLPEVEYPRTPGRRPSADEDPCNAWYVKTSVKGADEGILAGRQVVLKDNICLAGVPMMIGTSAAEGYVPELDATVVTRILAAGGEIVGKAKCEDLSRGGGSHTNPTGPVENPRKPGYSTGGSSSGCAAIVASGEVTMAIGGDQAGSIRFPSSFCGIYGLKPTWGLVPYTGVAPLEHTLDHVGPMTATVHENALLLGAIAGYDDGLDPRQSGARPASYSDSLDIGVDGLRIGVLDEGFGQPISEPDVDEAVRGAAAILASAGATVDRVSVPEHHLGLVALQPIFLQGSAAVLKAGGLLTNWRGLHPTSLGTGLGAWRDRPNEISDGARLGLLLAEHVERTGRGRHYAKAQNLSRRLRAHYDAALAEHDVLLMPTVPHKALKLPAPDAPLSERLGPGLRATANASPFNCTGHPALSVPCGSTDGLPIGMMLVSRWYDEPSLFRAAYAFEQAADWTKL